MWERIAPYLVGVGFCLGVAGWTVLFGYFVKTDTSMWIAVPLLLIGLFGLSSWVAWYFGDCDIDYDVNPDKKTAYATIIAMLSGSNGS